MIQIFREHILPYVNSPIPPYPDYYSLTSIAHNVLYLNTNTQLLRTIYISLVNNISNGLLADLFYPINNPLLVKIADIMRDYPYNHYDDITHGDISLLFHYEQPLRIDVNIGKESRKLIEVVAPNTDYTVKNTQIYSHYEAVMDDRRLLEMFIRPTDTGYQALIKY